MHYPLLHPRVHVLEHVAASRGVTLSLQPGNDSTKECVPALAAQAAPVAYIVTGTENMKQELYLRGPLLATLYMTQHFCDYWSHLLRKTAGADKPYNHTCKEKTTSVTVAAAVLGWTKDDAWIVAVGWNITASDLHDYGRNGCCLVKVGSLGLDHGGVGILQVQPHVNVGESSMQVHKCVHPFVPPALATKKPKVNVKAKVILAHGENKSQHPKSMMQKVSAGDIASITFMALTVAIVALFLCFSLTRRKKRGGKK